MNYEFQVLQNAVTNKTALNKLLTEAQLNLEKGKNKRDEIIMTVELANENDEKNGNNNNNNNNNNENN